MEEEFYISLPEDNKDQGIEIEHFYLVSPYTGEDRPSVTQGIAY